MPSQNNLVMSLFIRKSPLGCSLLAFICFFLVLAPVLCRGHSEDSPSFKYSREANENFNPNKANHHHDHEHHHHDHGHNDHDHGHHDHDHDHGHHDHDHGHHDHDHGHHDHDHGHHDHDHGHHDHDHGHHDHDHDYHKYHGNHQHSNRDGESRKNIDMSRVWLHAISSTLLISAAPFVLLYIIPLDNSEAMKPRLKVILAFASGGLLGDAFLHLIPHATHPHDHGEHNHDHNHDLMDKNDHIHAHSHTHDMTVGLWVLAGIIAFLSVEKIVRLLKGGSNHGHSHSHSNSVPKKSAQSNGKQSDKKTVKSTKVQKQDVAISGYLNLAADFAHNFTDGLAIGASYLAGNSIGVITTITILLHEVPHEIGDFAILIKSGCSKRKAMMLQLLTAVGAVGGTALALLGAGADNVTASWVLPFTAGGFIYIATVSVLPELLEESTKFMQSLKEIIALLGGVALMVFIANFE